jgi:peptide/nickel transport system permease protein
MKATLTQTENISPPTQEAQDEKRLGRIGRGLKLMRRRKKFYAGLSVVIFFYAVALFADFLAPYDYRSQLRSEPMSPPNEIHFRDVDGSLHARPFIYARRMIDPLERRYEEDTSRAYPLALFTKGYSYKLLGLLPVSTHLFGLKDEVGAVIAPRVQLLGTDAIGRDQFSRLLIAARFSLVVGPVGTLLACALGIFLGCIAGFSHRFVDALLMRTADAMLALPTLVLILAARAAFPLELPPSRAAILMISIFALVGWAEMARLARGLVLALRKQEFVLAAESIGLSKMRILFRHILPNAARPLLVQVTLMLPYFLLTETSLSFLGVGLQEPEASWGNMLAAAGDSNLLRNHPFTLLAPAFAIFIFVLGVRLLSDGLKARSEKGIS